MLKKKENEKKKKEHTQHSTTHSEAMKRVSWFVNQEKNTLQPRTFNSFKSTNWVVVVGKTLSLLIATEEIWNNMEERCVGVCLSHSGDYTHWETHK